MQWLRLVLQDTGRESRSGPERSQRSAWELVRQVKLAGISLIMSHGNHFRKSLFHFINTALGSGPGHPHQLCLPIAIRDIGKQLLQGLADVVNPLMRRNANRCYSRSGSHEWSLVTIYPKPWVVTFKSPH